MSFVKEIGIDLGTANTLIYLRGKGIVLREPSVVAVQQETKQVLAVGSDAKLMVGRTPGSIVAVRPMKGGVIADFEITQTMIRSFIRKAVGGNLFFKPRIIVTIPSGVTDVERRAVEEAVMQAGAREVFLIEEPMAAAIGATMPIDEPIGSMIVDIGGGTSEIAVISLGGVVTSCSIRVGGDAMDEAIIQYLRRRHNLATGEATAESIKKEVGAGYVMLVERTGEVRGRDLITGLPKTIEINSNDIRKALQENIGMIIDAIKNTLEKTPPELSADIMNRGIVLSGGGALLPGLDKAIATDIGMQVNVAERPLDCVALGTGIVIEDIGGFRSILLTYRR